MSAQGAINVRNKVSDLQSKLSHAAKSRRGSDFLGLVYWTLALCLWEVKY